MLLTIILFLFYVLHIHFMLKNIFWNVGGAYFFTYYTPYRFSRDVAMETFIFCVSCAIAFVIGYILSKCVLEKHSVESGRKLISEKYIYKSILYLNIFLALHIVLDLYALCIAGFNYSTIFNLRISMSFLFESRMLVFVLLGFVYLNKPPEAWLFEKRLRFTAILLALYFIISVLMQSRSVVFECMAVIGFCWLMWKGNKIKIKYLVILLCAIPLANLIVLPRLPDMDWQTTIAGIFSFEYAVLINNIVSSAIASNHPPLLTDFFIATPLRIIPSPLRNLLEIGLPIGSGGNYWQTVIGNAGVYGGGFSLLGEMFGNLGRWGISMFLFLGFLIGKLIKGASRVGSVSLLYATAPLIYAHFMMAFRNDFGTFAKASIQIILIAIIMTFILRIRWLPRTSAANECQRFKGIDTTIKDAILRLRWWI